jgi:hypothetical protein
MKALALCSMLATRSRPVLTRPPAWRARHSACAPRKARGSAACASAPSLVEPVRDSYTSPSIDARGSVGWLHTRTFHRRIAGALEATVRKPCYPSSLIRLTLRCGDRDWAGRRMQGVLVLAGDILQNSPAVGSLSTTLCARTRPCNGMR